MHSLVYDDNSLVYDDVSYHLVIFFRFIAIGLKGLVVENPQVKEIRVGKGSIRHAWIAIRLVNVNDELVQWMFIPSSVACEVA